jgi:hypothetical protein
MSWIQNTDYIEAVVGIRDILFDAAPNSDLRIRTSLKMDPAPTPDPTPDPTPFFSDFKGT